ncbi:MAG: hypothetical protein U1C71_01405, partial [archaeon]|nr:hypothetical protein [archaeon]
DIKFIRPKGHERKPNLIMRKNTIKPLKLNLTFDPISTFNLTKIRGEDKHKTTGNGWWGTRSVYHTK